MPDFSQSKWPYYLFVEIACMLKLDRSILPVHLKSLISQMVENGYLNITFPVTGRTDGWAKFYDGHPDHCQGDKSRPFVFIYGLQMSEEMHSISDTDAVRLTATIGVHAFCENLKGSKAEVEQIWWKIRYAFGSGSTFFGLPGVYTIGNTTIGGASLGDLGISGAQVIGDGLQLNTKEFFRYSAQVEFLLHFNAFKISFQDISSKTISIT